MNQGEKRLAAATPERPLPRMRTLQEQGDAMVRKTEKGGGRRPAGKPSRQVIRSGQGRGGEQELWSGAQYRGGSPGSGQGNQVTKGHRNPRSGRVSLGRKNYGVTPEGK